MTEAEPPYKFRMAQSEETLFGQADGPEVDHYGRYSTGILPSHVLRRLIRARREIVASEDVEDGQIQPASLDLRLGPVAWRVRASFLPGPNAAVREKLDVVALHEIDLTPGAVLETHCVYVVPLLESAELSHRVSGIANPKSSTGRQPVGNDHPGSRRVLHPGLPRGGGDPPRLRSREVPFILEHGQIIGRLVFERLTDPPPQVYGQGIGSNYQSQGLKLSKHFRAV